MTVIEKNPGPDYLGAGLANVDQIYFIMAAAFGGCTIAWAIVLYNSRQSPRLFKVLFTSVLSQMYKV